MKYLIFAMSLFSSVSLTSAQCSESKKFMDSIEYKMDLMRELCASESAQESVYLQLYLAGMLCAYQDVYIMLMQDK